MREAIELPFGVVNGMGPTPGIGICDRGRNAARRRGGSGGFSLSI